MSGAKRALMALTIFALLSRFSHQGGAGHFGPTQNGAVVILRDESPLGASGLLANLRPLRSAPLTLLRRSEGIEQGRLSQSAALLD
jgi:hypothetical protein